MGFCSNLTTVSTFSEGSACSSSSWSSSPETYDDSSPCRLYRSSSLLELSAVSICSRIPLSTIGTSSRLCVLAFSSATLTNCCDSSPFRCVTPFVVMSYMKISCSSYSFLVTSSTTL
uniref:(northern house mosquito) hypothetical protein n=1 Tax=Culex pipiens TaxID=7175 RepID=A0A8D8DL65_CULPI